MRKLIFLAMLNFTINVIAAPSLKIVSVTGTYPKMTAEFIVTDATNKEVRTHSLTDFTLKDAGIVKTIKTDICEPNLTKFSLVLTIDKSGSMGWGLNNEEAQQSPNRRMDAAVEAGKSLINSLPGYPTQPRADIALTAFSSGNYSFIPYFSPHDILSNFTYDIDSVKKLLLKIEPVGGTDYNVAFLGNKGQGIRGIMDLCDSAKYKPIVIFLTDGEHSPPAPFKPVNVGEIVNRAKTSRIPTTIYPLTLGFDITSDLAAIASQTGGKAYKTLSQDDITNNFNEILASVQNSGSLAPCTIEWDASCDGGVLELTYKPLNLSATFTYKIDPATKPDLSITQRDIKFKNVAKGVTVPQNVDLKALKADVVFTAVPVSTDSRFVIDISSISPLPFTLTKGTTKTIIVKYTPTDTACATANITFASTACTGNVMTASGGFIYAEDINCGFTPKSTPSLKTYSKKFCNYSCEDYTIIGVQTAGLNASEFVLKNAPASLLVKSGNCVDLKVEFTPTDVTARVASFVVKTDKGDFTGNFSGSGSGLADIQVAASTNATNISCVKPSSTITIPVSNPGALDLNITNISSSNPDFVIDPSTKVFTVGNGKSKNVYVVYSSVTNGASSSNITITSNADNKTNVVTVVNGKRDNIALQYVENVDVDFGVLCPGEIGSKNINIKNIGDISSNVTSSLIKTQFKNNTADGNYTAGEVKINSLQFSSPIDGNYTDVLTFKDECGTAYNINLKAKVETPLITAPAINITTTIGSPKTVPITLSNGTSRSITISAAQFIDNAKLIISELTFSPSLPWTVNANSTLIINVTYTPTPANPNVVSGVLELTGSLPCASTSTITSVGNPDKAVATLGLLNTNIGYLGQDVVIPVLLKTKTRFTESKAKSVTADISFDASVLMPTKLTPIGTVTNGVRTITGTFPSNGSNTDETFILDFSVLSSATVTSTALTIKPTPTTDNKAVNIIIENGLFTINTSLAQLLLIKSADFHQSAGNTIDFPIKLIDANGSLKSFNQGIKSQVRFNGSVLESVGITSKAGTKPNERIIDISQPIVFPEVDKGKGNSPQSPITYPVKTITFRAMLGTEVNSNVIVENVDVITGKVLVNPDSSMFTLDGVCTAGGVSRLYDPTKTGFLLTQINPNPVNGLTNVNYHILELGIHKMWVSDMLGNKVLQIIDDNFTEGDYTTQFDASLLPSGAYRIVLQSPTDIKSQLIQVLK